MLFVKSELLPINSRAGIRENLDIVIVGSSNLIADKAHSHPCAFSCQLKKMSLLDWQYPLFSTAVCLYFCQRKLNVNADPSTVGVAAVAEHAGGTVAGRAVQCCPWRDRLTDVVMRKCARRMAGALRWHPADGSVRRGGGGSLSATAPLSLSAAKRGGFSAAICFKQIQIPVGTWRQSFALSASFYSFLLLSPLLSPHFWGVNHLRSLRWHFLHHVLFVLQYFTWLLCVTSVEEVCVLSQIVQPQLSSYIGLHYHLWTHRIFLLLINFILIVIKCSSHRKWRQLAESLLKTSCITEYTCMLV